MKHFLIVGVVGAALSGPVSAASPKVAGNGQDELLALYDEGTLPTQADLKLGQNWSCSVMFWNDGELTSASSSVRLFNFARVGTVTLNRIDTNSYFSSSYTPDGNALYSAYSWHNLADVVNPKPRYRISYLRLLKDGRLVGLTYDDWAWPSANELVTGALCTVEETAAPASVSVQGLPAKEIYDSLYVSEVRDSDKTIKKTGTLECVRQRAADTYACKLSER